MNGAHSAFKEAAKATFLFTSESVGEGHPDKLCDQVSDAILDTHLAEDPDAKVACEAATKSNRIILLGEITSRAKVDYDKVVRDVVKRVGYNDINIGMDYRTLELHNYLEEQSKDIAAGVHVNREECGAGDQGLMFGYATNETKEMMPLTVVLSHALNRKLAELRRSGDLSWARPDTKAQVTCEYLAAAGGECRPMRVHTVVVSCQHDQHVQLEEIRKEILEKVIKVCIPEKYLDEETKFLINPCGKFVIGGPKGDAGLTGRKIIVDTYGGWGAHGGGAFSGKDFSKVDRSGAYAARWIAKSLVAKGLCGRCLVQLSYAIGVAEPLAITVDHYGTSSLTAQQLVDIVRRNFDLRPGCIVKDLNLKQPIFQETASYGHFGRDKFLWEQPKQLESTE